MQPVRALSESQAAGLEYILCDIDDTLTQDGFLVPESYDALWRLHRSGYTVIPVTGRPDGWCDMIIRQWPVEAVIGENGAFAMIRTDNGYELKIHSAVAPDEVKARLEEIREYVCAAIPGMKTARDQSFRWFDLALDFAEDPPRFGMETAVRIKELCEEKGAVAKISSIHVNTWFGDYSKLEMAQELLGEHFGLPGDQLGTHVFFCGDSPNDEPMFAFFPLSCGVANIRPFLHLMTTPPAFVTEKEYGRGFAEAAEIILNYGKRNSRSLT